MKSASCLRETRRRLLRLLRRQRLRQRAQRQLTSPSRGVEEEEMD